MYFPPFDTDHEPNETNIKIWMDNIYGKFEPLEQARWNQSNIDTLFFAGEQRFINSYFNFYPQYNYQSFHFNLLQQPVNMITGYQRQHRKSVNYLPIEGSDQEDADDLTKLVTYANNYRNILEKVSRVYEQSAVSGLVLMQPYLDYTDDPVNGTLDLKIWHYNEFMCDPYFREPDMSDCNFVWCQQYVSKHEAKKFFPKKKDLIDTMSGFGNRYGKFYFLPENYNLARNDLLVLSYVWYQSTRRKKLLYSRQNGISYDYLEKDEQLMAMIQGDGMFEVVEVDVPTWKQAVVLNEHLMFMDYNPLGFDECPFIPVFWNRDPQISQYDLRDRSLVRSMRDAQFLMNRRIILNHDISESSINSGYYRIENTIVNEDDLRYGGQGRDIIIKEGNQIQESIQKIVPNAVPPSDMQLADQLADLVFRVSGVNQELMGFADDSKAGITEMLRQGAGLVTLQKYFDQWDVAFKQLGRLEQKIIMNKWSPAKMARIIGKQVSPAFEFKAFSKFDCLVAEGLNTTIQQQQEFLQILQLNEMLGGIIPAKFILQKATIQGKNDIIQAIEEAQAQQAEMAKHKEMMEQNILEAKMQNMMTQSVANVATARERHGRAESNIGLFEERLSEITQNRSSALKARMEALEKLLGIVTTFGGAQAQDSERDLDKMDAEQIQSEDREKIDAKITADSNNFLTKMMKNIPNQNTMKNNQPIESGVV